MDQNLATWRLRNVVSLIHIVGSRQVVRHMVLVHAFGGSIPSSPAIEMSVGLYDRRIFLLLRCGGIERPNAIRGEDCQSAVCKETFRQKLCF